MQRIILLAGLLAVTACNEQAPTALNEGPALSVQASPPLSGRLFAQIGPGSAVSIFGVNDVDLIVLEETVVYITRFGRFMDGFATDGRSTLYAPTSVGGPGLDVLDLEINLLGRVAVVDPISTNLAFAAYRDQPQQVFVCNPVRTPFARLFVFDVADEANPSVINLVSVPGTDDAGGRECRGMAFDANDQLWVSAANRLIKLFLDASGAPDSSAAYDQPLNPVSIAFEPISGRLYYAAVNANIIAVVDTSNAGTPVATITEVCDNANLSPLSVVFSPGGDLFTSCADIDGATTDIVAFTGGDLAGITGAHLASTLNGRSFDLVANRASRMVFVPTFVDPADLLRVLIQRVVALELNKGLETALSATLEAALASLENDRPATVMQIEAFINQVEAKRGNQLTDAEADELISKAQDVIAAIEALS